MGGRGPHREERIGEHQRTIGLRKAGHGAVDTGQAEHSPCPGVPALLLLSCHTRHDQFPVDLT